MDEQIYENYSGDFPYSWASHPKDNENLYEDVYMNKAPETQVTRSDKGTTLASEPATSRSKCYRLAVVCLLILVVLLMPAIALLWIRFRELTIEKSQIETGFLNLTIEKDQIETSLKNLTIKRDELQSSFTNLTIERDQLQTSFNYRTAEMEQVKSGYKKVAEERNQLQTKRDELQKKLSQLKKDIDTPGWRYFSSSIYSISTEKKSWSESRQDCKGRGADLVIITSREEQDFVEVWRRGQAVWIGANDIDSEGTWKWVDGTIITTGFWNPGEPNSIGDEDCAVSGYQPAQGKWVDISCNKLYGWICEKRLNI